MSFQPSQTLLICEVNFIKLLNHHKNHEKIIDQAIPAPLPMPLSLNIHEEDESEPLCRFFKLLINLINKSLYIKLNLSNKLPIDLTKHNKELTEIKIQLLTQLIYLFKDKPLLWDYLLHRKAGRNALYYMLYTNMIHRRPWGSYNIFIDWAQALQETSTCEVENHLIKFIGCISIDMWSYVERLQVLYVTEEHLNNPFISAHLALKTRLQTSGEQTEKRMIFDLLKTPLPQSEKLPFFLKNFLGLFYSYHALNKLFTLKPTADELIEIFSQMHIPSYFPHLDQLIVKEPDCILHIIYSTYHYMRVHTRIFALSIDQEIIFKQWHQQLLFMLLKTYNKLYHIINITPETLFILAECCSELIQTRGHEHWHVAFENERDFWQTIGIIFNYEGYVKIDFIELLSKNVTIIVDNLIRFNCPEEAIYILGNYLETSYFKTHQEQQIYKNYDALFHLLKFYCLIPKNREHPNQELSDATEIQVLLDYFWLDMKEIKSSFDDLSMTFLNKSFNYLRQSLKTNIQKYFNILNPYINPLMLSEDQKDALYKTQGMIATLLKILGANSQEINNTLQDLKHLELSDIRMSQLFVESPIAIKSKPKTKSSEPALKLPSCVEPAVLQHEETQNHHISSNLLPQGLLTLAQKIKNSWQTNLILTGGAVTSLFLKRSNPYDYDCLLFDNNLSELSDKLNALGYTKNQIVGKEFPILKLIIEQGPENIKLDIAVFPFNPGLSLDENMAKILSLRDFKLSALYMVLGTHDKSFEIKGFDHAIRSVNLKLISIVENKKNVFIEDPVRLLRLVKIQLQYPDFRNDGLLNRILKQTCLKSCLRSFLSQKTNQGRFDTALENLFKRFEPMRVIDKMATLGLMDIISDSSYCKVQHFLPIFTQYSRLKVDDFLHSDKFKHYIPRPDSPISLDENERIENIKGYSTKLAFFHFLMAHYCLEHGQLEFSDWCFSSVLRRVRPLDYLATTFIQDTLWKLPASCQIYDVHLLQMLTQMQMVHSSHIDKKLTPASNF